MLYVFGVNEFEVSHYRVRALTRLPVTGLLAPPGLLGRVLREFLGGQLLGNLVLDLSYVNDKRGN